MSRQSIEPDIERLRCDFNIKEEASMLAVDPMSGEELERTVTGFFKLKPATLAKLKSALK